jgi:ribosomal protein S18 acetylase RimI-like enzyme
MAIEIRVLGGGDAGVLSRVAEGLFDRAINPALTEEFLNDARHHKVVAIESDVVVGFVSAVHYVHPDKPAELWINEVAVAPGHRRREVGKRMLAAMLTMGEKLGCREAWVLTDRANLAAMKLYESAAGAATAREQMMYTSKRGVAACDAS